MTHGIGIELIDTVGSDDEREIYELADAQFDRYRPPTHRYLALDRTPTQADWLPISERIGAPLGAGGRALLPTFTAAHHGRLADLDDWYTTHHVPQVVTVEGFAAGQRFAHTDPQAEYPRLALYELDAADPGAALERLTAALPAMVQTDALDGSSIASWLYLRVR